MSTKVKVGGVKTDAGKEVTKYNAVKHGILRETVAEYEKVDEQRLYNELAADLQPRGKVEEILVELAAVNLVKLQRISKAEREFVADFSTTKGLNIFDARNGEFPAAVVEKLLVYSRYQTATENRIFRILGALKCYKNSD